ncbi:MAG TPA: GPW/gp25 family protein, partial [Rhodanobacter sp.]|nr:GPW/gp25 family protein [Rhodanobacter sp.]
MRRTYGSDLFALLDRPLNVSTRMDLIAATADALSLWEPRLQVTKVDVTQPSAGQILIDVTGIYLPDGVPVRIDGIAVN